MARIEIIKTWYGNKYAVVEDFKHYPVSRDEKGNTLTVGKGKKPQTDVAYTNHAVEYKVGKEEKDVRVAIFPLTKEGLKEAKEVLALFKKQSK